MTTVISVPEDPKWEAICEEIVNCIDAIEVQKEKFTGCSNDVQRSSDSSDNGPTAALNKLDGEIKKAISVTKLKLDKLKQTIANMRRTPEDASANADIIVIIENQHMHLGKKLMASVDEYVAMMGNHSKVIRDITAKRIKLRYTTDKGCTITDTQALEYAQDILDQSEDSAQSTSAKQKFGEIMENRADFIKMQKSLRELTSMHNDLASLINEQSELMTMIDHNLQKTNDYVAKGRENLDGAKGHAKKSRTCTVCAFVIIGVILLIILAIVLGLTA